MNGTKPRALFLSELLYKDLTNLKLFVSSSQEPDAKRQRVDDSSPDAANAVADTQANNSAYNNWYQVGFLSEQSMALKKVSLLSIHVTLSK